MPLPYTDEGAIIGGILGPDSRTLTDLYDRLTQILTVLQAANQLPAASILVQEFFSSQDLDFGKGSGDSVNDTPPINSSVYGKSDGFMIDDNDPEFPIILNAVHDHPDFQFPSIVLSWQQFLAS